MANIKIDMPVKGMDLLSQDTAMPAGYARSIINTNIHRDGTFKRRAGRTLAVAGSDFHSIATTPHGVLVGKGRGLYRIDGDPQNPIPLCSLEAIEPIDFTSHNGNTYLTNGHGVWWIPQGEQTPRPCGVPSVSTLPDIEPSATGSLAAGDYTVAISVVDDRGEESAAVFVGNITLSGPGGIRLRNLPVSLDEQRRVYITQPGGSELYLSEQFAGAFSEYLITRQGDGAIRHTQHLKQIPAGDFIRARNGRIYTAEGDTLWFSQAMRPHLCDPRHDHIKFTGDIRFIEPITAGLLVADQRGVWLLEGDDPVTARMRSVSQARIIHGSSLKMPATAAVRGSTVVGVVIWLTEHGYMVASDFGETESLNSAQIRINSDLRGRTVLIEDDGAAMILTLAAAGQIFSDLVATTRH